MAIPSERQIVKSNQPELPIFFLQLGSKTNLFFDQVLKQAALSNGKENVFILTDTNFQLYTAYNCIDVAPFINGEREFDHFYQHHSTNPYFFEKACFDRWFIMKDLAADLGFGQFVHADCDVLIMEDLKPLYQKYIKGRYDGTVMFFERDGESVTSGHTSFWNTRLINDFCNFVTGVYKDKKVFDIILKDTVAGKFLDNRNVSDMILLDVFRTETKPNALNLLSLEDEGISVDFNVNVAYNGWKHQFICTADTKIKKLHRRGGSLYGRVAGPFNEQKHAKFYTLHFQGYLTKALIPQHVTAQNILEYIANYILSKSHYAIRRLKLFKNRIKRKVLR
ncbi:hypothetical protein A0256_22900 [Mucilaginibacter sp. PAMC 26640]|nr:hypothetical protein A0256_22900 [Mucilaginibacter sp. PAMC 26640]